MNFLDTEGLRTYTERLLEIIGLGGGGANIDGTKTEFEALQGEEGIIYLTIDTQKVIYNGKVFGGSSSQSDVERVALKLIVPDDVTVNWSTLKVIVQNESSGGSQELQLGADGQCAFEIPIGERYAITLPYVEGQDQPSVMKYTAMISNRTIDYYYTREYESLTLRFVVRSDQYTAADFTTRIVEVVCSDGSMINGVIADSQVTILVPYGIEYYINVPEFAGMSHNHGGIIYKSGIPARNIVYSYIDYHNLHVFGYDANGTAYSIAEVEAMGQALARQTIVAGAYNDETLANAARKNGGRGCGFCWSIDSPTVAGAWASHNVDFGTNNTIIQEALAAGVLTEACGYYTNHDLAFAVKDGSGESALVMQVGRVLADAGVLNQDDPTPLFRICEERQCPVTTSTNKGFALSFGQFYALRMAKNEMDALYTALGLTAPNILNAYWQSSLQYSATNAVGLYNGGFSYGNKTTSNQALVGFDLP